MASENLENVMEEVLVLVHKAGEVIRTAINSDKAVQTKSSEVDLVTETDKAVEEFLCNGIKAKFPNHQFIGEESSAETGQCPVLTEAPTWIIDPIDGTMNFVHSNPGVSISMGLAIDKKISLAIVYLPVYDQLYTAIRGQGTKLNKKPVKVSTCKALSKGLCIFELWGRNQEVFENQTFNVKVLLEKAQAIRSIGSAAMNLALVAAGQADVYFQCGLHSWDMAAGALLVQEAGGVVLDPSGQPFDVMSRRVLVASTPELAQDVMNCGVKFMDYPDRDQAEPVIL